LRATLLIWAAAVAVAAVAVAVAVAVAAILQKIHVDVFNKKEHGIPHVQKQLKTK
jgi:hypothetical protein